jgi:hypothetical protein
LEGVEEQAYWNQRAIDHANDHQRANAQPVTLAGEEESANGIPQDDGADEPAKDGGWVGGFGPNTGGCLGKAKLGLKMKEEDEANNQIKETSHNG